MAALYELVILGTPAPEQLTELREIVATSVSAFGLVLGDEVAWTVLPEVLELQQQRATAAIFFGGVNAPSTHVEALVRAAVPILPVVSELTKVSGEIPPVLQRLNCLDLTGGMQRVASALLECAGLLPKQRTVFLSYRRTEARAAALQLYDALSARLFDVFLDTHDVAPAEDFQAVLWHRLCDSDVLIMLDTPSYFDSRWTSAEFGRALAKGIAVLRVGWPDTTPSIRTQTSSRVELVGEEVERDTGRLAQSAIDRVCTQAEAVRSQSLAVRTVNLVSNLRNSIETIGGRVVAVGPHKAVHIELADGCQLIVYPTLGVPTSWTLHQAAMHSANNSAAVVFDHIGLHPHWLAHIDWLGTQIREVRWLKSSEAAWELAAWEGGR